MKSLQVWLDEYGESHQNRINKLIHYVCVPAIYVTVMGLLWAIPSPFEASPNWLNWALLLAVPVMGFYFALSFVVGLGMTVFTAMVLLFLNWWQFNMPVTVLTMSISIFILAWVMQFVGHKVEGKKPSFFKDVQFLLIGPVWILCHLFQKVKIKY
mgnify:FL=1